MRHSFPVLAVTSASILLPIGISTAWSQTFSNPAGSRQSLGLPPPPASSSPGIDGIPSATLSPGLNQPGTITTGYGTANPVYYVSPNGTDGGTPCLSISTACATVQHALNFGTLAGSVISIIPGKVYGGGVGSTAPVVFSNSGSGPLTGQGGACSQPIILETYPFAHDRAIIAGTRGASGAGAVTNSGAVSCIVINRLEFSGWNADLPWAYVSENAAVTSPYVTSTTYDDYAIEFYGSINSATYSSPTNVHHIIIANSYVHDFPGGGIGAQHVDYMSVLNNVVTNSAQDSPYNGSCISLYQSQNFDLAPGTHNLISGNFTNGCINLVPNAEAGLTSATLTASVGAGARTIALSGSLGYLETVVETGFNGCLAPGTQITAFLPGGLTEITPGTSCAIAAGTTIVAGNVTDGHGIIIDNNSCSQYIGTCPTFSGLTLVENNITTGNGSSGIQVGPASSTVDVVFNTTWDDQVGVYETKNATKSDGAISIMDAPGPVRSTSNVVANNIVVAGSLVICGTIESTGSNTWTNNLFFSTGTLCSAPTLAPGINNVVGEDPKLEQPVSDFMTSDFRVLPSSPAIGAGSTAYTRTTDYAGAPGVSSGAPTMGAFEMGGSAAMAFMPVIIDRDRQPHDPSHPPGHLRHSDGFPQK